LATFLEHCGFVVDSDEESDDEGADDESAGDESPA
jgi:hypothetical protein